MEQGRSVNALVRDFIIRLAGESDAALGIAEFLGVAREAVPSRVKPGRTGQCPLPARKANR
ncbi:MAG: hypothetical protein ACREFO_00330 [Acetobacteraceae bacterium]